LSLLVGLTGGHQSAFIGLSVLSMFFPAFGVLAVNIGMKQPLSIDWQRFPLCYIPVALFLMPAVMHVVMLPLTSALEGGLPWQDWLKPQADGQYHTPEKLGWGTVTHLELAGRVLANAAVGLILVSSLTLFEEIGWRAWLLPRMVSQIGSRRAI